MTTQATPVDALSARIEGSVLEGGAAAEAATPWNLMFSHRPALTVRPEHANDVAEAVAFAARHGLPVGVQCTGHGIAHGADGGMLILTSGLDELDVDPASRTARIGAGLMWGPVLAAAQEHGLTPLLGSAPHVGAVGYTLGGGMGWLARKHGLCSDSVRAVDIVTPDGVQRRASAEENPDLFWALLGGGAGTLGVVTALELELVEVTDVYAGNLLYPAEHAREVVAEFAEWAADLPDEMTAAVVLMNFPPFEDVPEPLRGRSFVMVRGCWCGDLEAGAAVVDRMRARREPVMDMFGPMPWSEMAAISQDPVDPIPALSLTECLRDLDPEVTDSMVEATFGAGSPPPILFTEIRQGGGALGRGRQGAAAPTWSGVPWILHAVGVPNPDDPGALAGSLAAYREILAPAATGHAYLNFLDGEEKAVRTPEAFGAEEWRRLQSVKASVDPEARFRFGMGIGV